jgi:hypothetical protein
LVHPPPRNRETDRRFFVCNVAISAEFDAILCPLSDMDRPMPAADALTARYAECYLDNIAERSPDIDGKVRELVAALLPTGRCSIDRAAGHLAHHAQAARNSRRNILRHYRRPARRIGGTLDRGPNPLTAKCRRTTRLFHAKRVGALVP